MVAGKITAFSASPLADPESVEKALWLFSWSLAVAWSFGAGLSVVSPRQALSKAKLALHSLVRDFAANPRALVVLLCVLFFFAIPLLDGAKVVDKRILTYAFVAMALICSALSLAMFWQSKKLAALIARWPATKFVMPVVSFCILVWAKAIADERVQQATGVSPEELTTAAHAMAGLYAVVIAMLLSAWLFVFAGLTAAIDLMRGSPKGPAPGGRMHDGEAPGRSDIERPIMLLGMFFSSMTLSMILASPWTSQRLDHLSIWLLVETSFFAPSEHHRECLDQAPALGSDTTRSRALGDGGRILAVTADGVFMSIECNRKPSLPPSTVRSP